MLVLYAFRNNVLHTTVDRKESLIKCCQWTESLFLLLLYSDSSVPSGLSLLSNIVTKQSVIWELSIGFVTSLLPNIGFKNKKQQSLLTITSLHKRKDFTAWEIYKILISEDRHLNWTNLTFNKPTSCRYHTLFAIGGWTFWCVLPVSVIFGVSVPYSFHSCLHHSIIEQSQSSPSWAAGAAVKTFVLCVLTAWLQQSAPNRLGLNKQQFHCMEPNWINNTIKADNLNRRLGKEEFIP